MKGSGGNHSWLRLDAHFLHDEPLFDAVQSAGCGPIGFLAWVQMLALAKQQRRVGEVSVLLHDLAMIGVSIEQYDALVDALAARDLVVVLEREPSRWRLSIVGWAAWQSTSSTERSRDYRQRLASRKSSQATENRREATEGRRSVTQTGDWRLEDSRLQSVGSGALPHAPALERVRGGDDDRVDRGSGVDAPVASPLLPGVDLEDGGLGTLRAAVTDSDAENVPDDESSPDVLSSRDAAIAAAQKLREVINADTTWMADQIGLKITYGRLPPAAAIKAAEQLVDRVAGGWRPNQPDRVFGYYLSTIASCAVEVSLVDPEAVARANRKQRLDEYVRQFNEQET